MDTSNQFIDPCQVDQKNVFVLFDKDVFLLYVFVDQRNVVLYLH